MEHYNMEEELYQLGYTEFAGYPTDALIEGEPCTECGEPVEYRAFRKGDSYRAFAVCNSCGLWEEF